MEQIRGTGTTAKSDIYSLAATLYQRPGEAAESAPPPPPPGAAGEAGKEGPVIDAEFEDSSH